MAFRTLEINKPSEVHVNKGQLEITNDDGLFKIPLEDLSTIVCSGSNIRMSTMAQAQIASAGISLMIIDEKYHPACILTPIESNVRQSLVMRKQIAMTACTKNQIWIELITRKIENQARALTLLGKEGSEKVMQYTFDITADNIDVREENGV